MRRGQRKNPNTDSWVRQIYRLKFQTGTGKRYLSTGKSRDLGIRQNHLPAAAAEIPLGTIYRVARELGLTPWELGLGGG
ncbi:MAG: hypothetical protein C4567_18790 [Deltaproteobacteria bacterium]|nr:MAG: hypothetical protein C4567_18790 [Deltaproteobacteria bacterium]